MSICPFLSKQNQVVGFQIPQENFLFLDTGMCLSSLEHVEKVDFTFKNTVFLKRVLLHLFTS